MTQNIAQIIAYTHGKLIVNEFGNGFVNVNINTNTNTNINTNKNSKISIYIKKNDLNRAFNNEIVDVEYYQGNDNKYYGKVINFSLVGKTFIGTINHFYKKDTYVYVSELTKTNLIIIKNSTNQNLSKNNWLYVKINEEIDNKLFGEIIEILNQDIDCLIEKKFNMKETQNGNIDSSISIKSDCIDQRNLDTFTIDPITCQDCDDAFSIEKIENSELINIYVHISDVAHYINPSIGPDFEKMIRKGNTFYGAKKNWPMIPREYSENYCSILPNKETNVVTTQFIYNTQTKQLDYHKWFYSIIISKNKYYYEQVDENFDDSKFQLIYETSQLIKKDMNDFIMQKESKSHEMIRYWMVKTNQIMCKEVSRIYRCNPPPNMNSLKLIKEYINLVSKSTDTETVETTDTDIDISREKIIDFYKQHDTPLLSFIIKFLLQKAYYTEEYEFHYGLGIYDYTHWTSPIRRAADLLNHCILKGYNIDIEPYLDNINHSEIIQNLIENFIQEYNNIKKVSIDEEFTATIIGLNPVGCVIYIEEIDYKYSIHISRLSTERLFYDKESNQLKNISDNTTRFKLFDNIKIKVDKITNNTIEYVVI
jgi:ribonuclease R